MKFVDIKTIIAIIAALSGIALGWMARTRTNRQDIQNEAGSGAVLRTDVEYIKRGVDDIRIDVRMQGQRVDGLAERVTRVEESSKQAHKRLDRIEHE